MAKEQSVTLTEKEQNTIKRYASHWGLSFERITQVALLKGVQVLEAEMGEPNGYNNLQNMRIEQPLVSQKP